VDYKPEKVAYKGKELQALEKQGVHVIVLEKNYKPESLDAARKRGSAEVAPFSFLRGS
jgi:hypothetical protein